MGIDSSVVCFVGFLVTGLGFVDLGLAWRLREATFFEFVRV